MLLLSLVEDPEDHRPIWVIEFDEVLLGRFETKEAVAAYLRTLGRRIDTGDEWPRHRIL
jgi:hypothetical protein